MAYLIDSDWAIDHLGNVPEAVRLLTRLSTEGIAISIVTYMEIYQGVERSPEPQRARDGIRAFVDAIPVLAFSRRVARRCAGVREGLRRRGRRVNARALDLIIAATALEHGLSLVTRNLEDYRDIPGLRLWAPMV